MSIRDRTIGIDRLGDLVYRLRDELHEFEAAADEGDDEGNEERVNEIERALDDIEGMIGDLVP